MDSDVEYQATLNIIKMNRIQLNEMMRNYEDILRSNKTKIKTTYSETGANRKEHGGNNQYGVSCADIVTSIMSDNEILIKRINEIKLTIQTLKIETKKYNNNKHQKLLYLAAFMAAAELELSVEQFIEIENKALKLMIGRI